MRIDSHQHFWNYESVKDAWITSEMRVLKRNFTPADMLPLLQKARIDAAIAVQALDHVSYDFCAEPEEFQRHACDFPPVCCSIEKRTGQPPARPGVA